MYIVKVIVFSAPPTLSIPDQVYIQPYLVSVVSVSNDYTFLAIGQCPGLLSLFDLTATSKCMNIDIKFKFTRSLLTFQLFCFTV